MNTTTYIITCPQELLRSSAAESFACAVGCTNIVTDWNGTDPLSPGDCAITTQRNVTPPDNGHTIYISDEAQLIQLAADIYTLRRDPPHIEHALQRITHGASGERESKLIAAYHATLRQRLNDTFRLYDDAERMLEAYRNKRAVDGLNGRPWDSSEHLKAENQITKLESASS